MMRPGSSPGPKQVTASSSAMSYRCAILRHSEKSSANTRPSQPPTASKACFENSVPLVPDRLCRTTNANASSTTSGAARQAPSRSNTISSGRW